jgi:hypothetical protein
MTGRPSDYTEALGLEICRRIAEGQALREICRDEDMPSISAVLEWALVRPDFAELYARARDMQADVHADELTQIADDGRNDWMERNDPNNPGYVANGEEIRRAQLRIDTRKWIAAKLKPRKYGDKQQIEVTHRYADMDDADLEAEIAATLGLPSDRPH